MDIVLKNSSQNLVNLLKKLRSLNEELKTRLERKKCNEDYIYFCQTVLGYQDVREDIHYLIGDKLTHSFERGLGMIPRKHLKTTMIVGWILWIWTRNPNIRFGIGSATGKHGEDIISELQSHIMSNEKFIKLYGEWYKKGGWTKQAFNIAARTAHYKNKSCETFSVGKDVTGAHYDIIILDDVAIRDNSETATMREKQIKLYKDCLDLIVNDQEKPFLDKQTRKGVILVIGTRWHFGDLYNYLLTIAKNSMDFIIDEPVMVNEEIQEADPLRWRSKIKELLKHPKTKMLAPKMFDIKYARNTYTEKGTYEFSCQQMNFPTSDESAAFKAEDLLFVKQHEVPGGLQKYMLVDPAGDDSTYERADYWAAVTVGISPEYVGTKLISRIYILDCIVESKISSNKFLEMMADSYEKHGHHRIVIEKNFAKTYINIFKEKYPYLQHKVLSITASNQKSKYRKILGLQPYTENQNLLIVEEEENISQNEKPFGGKILLLNKGKQELLDEIVDFGNTDHDDAIDALASVLEVFKPAKRRVPKKYTWEPRSSKTGY